MLRTLLQLLGFLLLVWLGLCLLLYFFQRSLIYFPVPAPSGDPASSVWLETPEARLRISTRPGAEGAAAVLYFGGNAEDVAGTLPDLASVLPDHALYLTHYRGYGGSSGHPSEVALVSDALALFDEVHRRHPAVVVIGRSLGSGVAVQLAARRPVQRLVLVTPFDSLLAVARRHYPWVPVDGLLRDRFESDSLAGDLRMPTTLIVAGHDLVIDPSHARRLLERFSPGLAQLKEIPRAGHNDISLHPAYPALLQEAVTIP